jgi:hypothetical protein
MQEGKSSEPIGSSDNVQNRPHRWSPGCLSRQDTIVSGRQTPPGWAFRTLLNPSLFCAHVSPPRVRRFIGHSLLGCRPSGYQVITERCEIVPSARAVRGGGKCATNPVRCGGPEGEHGAGFVGQGPRGGGAACQGDRTILTRLLTLSYSAFSAASTKTPHERRRARCPLRGLAGCPRRCGGAGSQALQHGGMSPRARPQLCRTGRSASGPEPGQWYD